MSRLCIPSLLLVACADRVGPRSQVEIVTEAYLEQGITCETVAMYTELDGAGKDRVADTLIAEGGQRIFDELMELGGGCLLEERLAAIAAEPAYPEWMPPQPDTHRHVGAGNHTVEHIESNLLGSAGSSPSGIYLDQAAYGWMCGSTGGADSISLTYLSGAYANYSSLRVKPRNVWSSCYLILGADARVYTDDHIAMCIGDDRIFLCGALLALTSDFTTRR